MSRKYLVRRGPDDPFEADELKRLVAADRELRWGKGGIEWRARDEEYASLAKEDPDEPDAVFHAGAELSCDLPEEPALGKLAQIARRLDAGLFQEGELEEDVRESWIESYPPGVAGGAAAKKPKRAGKAPREYSPKATFEEGEKIAHSTFGVGVVRGVESSTRITVDFAGTLKKLAQGL
jgi:hypothetical protein